MTAFIGSPLPYPLFSIVNTLIGVVIFFLITGLGVFYTNTWWTQYLPIASVRDPLLRCFRASTELTDV